jgi:ATP-dependent phosphofructokinase / diphosphate-dependent phosphofructokinase
MTAKRIALAFGGGYVPGLNAVVSGTISAASEFEWEVVGIRDGFDGVLFPERYPEGGIVPLSHVPGNAHVLTSGAVLGTDILLNPFRVRRITPLNQVEEVDRSDELLDLLRHDEIDAVVAVVGPSELGVIWKLSRKGLPVVCIPKSAENDIAACPLSFGYNSTLSFATEMLVRAREAAEFTGRVGVVEVLGEHAGWLALQAATAAQADAVLIPEIPCDLRKIAAKLRKKSASGRASGLVVVAEGAKVSSAADASRAVAHSGMKAALSPSAAEGAVLQVFDRSGCAAREVTLGLQRLTDFDIYPLVLGQLAKGGPPTVVDAQLALGYAVGAVRAVRDNRLGSAVVFHPPELALQPIAELVNKYKTVPRDSELLKVARGLGIQLGD